MHIIGSIVLACQSQKQLMLWAFMPLLTKTFSLKKKGQDLIFSVFLSKFINHDRIFIYTNFLVPETKDFVNYVRPAMLVCINIVLETCVVHNVS